MERILIINPGSTSSKIAVYEDTRILFVESIRHEEESAKYPQIFTQLDFRRELIENCLTKHNCAKSSLTAVIGRGGLLRPVTGGTYRVNELMLADLRSCRYGEHASNLGAILAQEIAAPLNLPAFIADPVVVDELIPEARYTGWPAMQRRSIFHALNQKAVAKKYAKEIKRPYAELRLIVIHMGGGLSVGAHCEGRVIDVNNALDGDGPFSAERTGSLPLRDILDICFSGAYSKAELKQMFVGKGGLFAYLGTKDGLEIRARLAAGDTVAQEVMAAMAYQVAKEAASLAASLAGKIDAIIITGGLAHLTELCCQIEQRLDFLAPIKLLPGEDEMEALALAALEVLSGETVAQEYLA